MLNKITLGYVKSIVLPTKVINLSLAQLIACDFIFFTQSLREKESRVSLSFFARPGHRRPRVSSCFSRFFFFFSLPHRSRGPTERWAGSIDGLRDDSVQRGVRNSHAWTSRRAAPAAHTGETHESGSLLVAANRGV